MTSQATKRKHVTKEVTEEFILPEGQQEIVKVVASVGNNLHQVVNCHEKIYLVTMPTKFRRNIWIKRGDFVIVTPIEEGDKVQAEIATVLYKEQIKYIKESQCWPKQFNTEKDNKKSGYELDRDLLPPSDSDSGGEDVVNLNHPPAGRDSSQSDGSELDEN